MSLRLFVALDLPAAAVGALVRFRDATGDPAVWRPLPPETFHVTLAFLGRREEDAVEAVAGVFRRLGPATPIPLALGAGLRLPRVLTVAVKDPSGALGSLRASLAAGLAHAGVFEPEARPFRPHVTVARLRGGGQAPRTPAVAPEAVCFAAGPLVLYRSHLGRAGARFEALVSRSPG